MPKSIESLVSFSAGEWSPYLTSRVDQQKYRAACLQLRNMFCLKTGPATRRPGTQFIAPAKTIALPGYYAIRLSDFQYSIDTTFILEWGFHYLRFYSNGAQVTVSSAPIWVTGTTYTRNTYVEDPGDSNNIYRCFSDVTGSTQPHSDFTHWVKQTIYELYTPYDAIPSGYAGLSASEVFQLQFCQINDVVYIVHPLHPRYKLTRLSDTNWTLAPVVDTVPALLDQSATDTTISSSATTGTTSLTVKAPGWFTATYYEVANSIVQNAVTPANPSGLDVIYNCVVAHTSGTFLTDLANGDWQAQAIFKAGHVGSYWELSYLRDAAYVEYTGTAASGFSVGTSATITAFGNWEVRSYGTWSADVAVQASSDGGVIWRQVRQITGRNDRNANITGKADVPQLYRIVVTNVAVPTTPGSTDPRIVFECVDAFLFGIVQITAVTDALHATATVVTQLTVANAWVSGKQYFSGERVGYSGINYIALNSVTSATPPPSDATNWLADGYPTPYWSEGAWSDVRGYPRAITAFQQRIWCGFSTYEPQRAWGTQVGDIENWNMGDQTLATDGLAFDFDAVGDGSGVWLQSQDALFAGLVSAEWVISSSDPTLSIGPTSVTAHRQSKWGSNTNIQAKVVGDALIFAQRQGLSIRQMLFSFSANKYMSQDITALSDQILNQGAYQMAYQQQGQKNGFLWATTAGGELVAMTYELDQEIYGWSRHTTGPNFIGLPTDDRFESVACIPGKDGDDDEVWVIVSRKIGTNFFRYVERLNPANWYNSINSVAGAPGYPADKNSAYYVDAGVTYQDPTTNVFTGLDHLEGRTVTVAINGQDYGTYVVASGSITVPNYTFNGIYTPHTIANIGLPFKSTVQPMNLDVDVHTGVTKGLIKKVTGITVDFKDTLACKFTDGSGRAGSVRDIIFANAATPFAETPLFTGSKQIRDFPGDYGLSIPVILYTDGPLPLTVLSVSIDYGISGTT